MLGSGFVINISLFQMVPPTMQKDITTGPADREGPCFGGKDKIKRKTQTAELNIFFLPEDGKPDDSWWILRLTSHTCEISTVLSPFYLLFRHTFHPERHSSCDN